MQVQKNSIHWTNGKQRMHLKKRFPFNERNVIKISYNRETHILRHAKKSTWPTHIFFISTCLPYMYFPLFWSFFFITLLSLNGNRFFKCILCFPLVQWIEIFCTCIFRVKLFLNTFFTVYTAKLAFIRQMSWKFDTQSALNVFFPSLNIKIK